MERSVALGDYAGFSALLGTRRFRDDDVATVRFILEEDIVELVVLRSFRGEHHGAVRTDLDVAALRRFGDGVDLLSRFCIR